MNTIHWNAVVGAGTRREVPAVLASRCWKRAWVVVDPGVADKPIIRDMLDDWSKRGVALHTTVGPRAEPTYADLELLRRDAASPPDDVVIGVGGGTALDVAKGLAVLATNDGPALEYRGFDRFSVKPLPVIAVPTIAGSGADVTPNASFVDTSANKKLGINGEGVRPVLGLLDAELAASAPLGAAYASAFDALVHAVEAYGAKKANDLTRHLAFSGVRTVWRGLATALSSGPSPEAFGDLLAGASLAALAMGGGGSGAAAALSYPVGVHLRVPHGLAGALFLPDVVDVNVARGALCYADLLDAVPRPLRAGAGVPASESERALAFAAELRWLRDALQLTVPAGVAADAGLLEAMSADLHDLRGALDNNAAPFSVEDGRDMLGRVFSPN